jgi:16S rRNA (guanine966-N2)-methyltransferase
LAGKRRAVALKVIAGEKRGLKLYLPSSPDFRPTAAKVREAIFSMLGEERVRDARVLDLYAGSGAMGLEAKSRGAKSVLFTDNNKSALAVIKKNIALFPEGSSLFVRQASFPEGYSELPRSGPFDLIFLDPPYLEAKEPINFLKASLELGICLPNCVLVWEMTKRNLGLMTQKDFKPWILAKSRSWGTKGAAIFELAKRGEGEGGD